MIDRSGLDVDQEAKLQVLIESLERAVKYLGDSMGQLDTGSDFDHDAAPIRRFITAVTQGGLFLIGQKLEQDKQPSEACEETLGLLSTLVFFTAREYVMHLTLTKER